MNRMVLISGIIYEVIGVTMILRLWTRKPRPGIVERCFLSVVLLVPFFGWIFYFFLRTSSNEHGDYVGTHSCGYGVGDTGHDIGNTGQH